MFVIILHPDCLGLGLLIEAPSGYSLGDDPSHLVLLHSHTAACAGLLVVQRALGRSRGFHLRTRRDQACQRLLFLVTAVTPFLGAFDNILFV